MRIMHRQLKRWTPAPGCVVAIVLACGAWSLTAAAEPSREELEKRFAEELSGAVLVGRFTIEGQADENKNRQERYAIRKVSKLEGDLWLFESTIEYGGKSAVTVPIPLQVHWAGDTPVITLTDLTIPLLGTYTARVLIYRGQYAGTWSAKDHGGHMYGRILRAEAEQPNSGAESKPPGDEP